MFESKTYNVILQNMLNRVPNSIDKREGSLIYNALAPAAIELVNAYIDVDRIIAETFADTANRAHLIKRCYEKGITPYPATKAILRGEFNIDVPIGSRFSLEALNYLVTEKISTGVFKLECETAGEVGNQALGTLIPIEYIEGLTSAEITSVLIPGEDEEDTETLRARYFDSFNNQAFGGNVNDYKNKTKGIAGVGGVKVYPVWNGGGTVKLVIQNSEFEVPSTELVDDVQTTIDPVVNQGEGLGLAPIGHVVTVEGVTTQEIDITTTISYQLGYNWESISSYVESAIDAYFAELSADWENQINLIVRISQIESRLLNIVGVLDVTGTTLNGNAVNLVLAENKIPLRGDVIG